MKYFGIVFVFVSSYLNLNFEYCTDCCEFKLTQGLYSSSYSGENIPTNWYVEKI